MNTQARLYLNIAVLALCSFSQHMPFMFMLVAIPVMLRQGGAPLDQVGLVTLVFLPLAFQFLWAPWLDRRQITVLGRWRGWLIVTQASLAAGLVILAFVSAVTQFKLLLALGFCLSFISATQKIAQGAFAVEIIPDEKRPWANMAIGLGSAAGAAAGTIGMMLLMQSFGWTSAMLFCSLVLALAAIALLASTAPTGPQHSANRVQPSLRALRSLPAGRSIVLISVAVCLPLGGIYSLLQPLLVDRGYSGTEIGVLNGLGYLGAWILFGPAAARLVQALGPRGALPLLFVLMAAVALIMLLAVSVMVAVSWLLITGVFLIYAILCFGFVSLYTVYMRAVREGLSATDFSALVCLFGIIMIGASPIAGLLAKTAGYETVFACSAGLSLVAGLLIKHLGQTPQSAEA